MKNVTKVSLVGACLSLLLASIVVTTFAWFQVTRTATVYVNNIGVYSSQGNLKMKYVGHAYGGVTSVTGDESPEMSIDATSGAVTDISGDGVRLYKPHWIPGQDGHQASGFELINNTLSTQYFISYGIQFQNDGSSSFDLCLSSSQNYVTYGNGDSSSSLAAKSTRICLSDASDDSIKCLWQYDETDHDDSYEYLKDGMTGAYGSTDFGLADPETDFPDAFHEGTFSTINGASDPLSAGQKVTTVAGSSSKTINVTIWIEGTLSSSTNACVGGVVSVNMKFVAI